jgi:hypothetical protein
MRLRMSAGVVELRIRYERAVRATPAFHRSLPR